VFGLTRIVPAVAVPGCSLAQTTILPTLQQMACRHEPKMYIYFHCMSMGSTAADVPLWAPGNPEPALCCGTAPCIPAAMMGPKLLVRSAQGLDVILGLCLTMSIWGITATHQQSAIFVHAGTSARWPLRPTTGTGTCWFHSGQQLGLAHVGSEVVGDMVATGVVGIHATSSQGLTCQSVPCTLLVT